MQLVVRSLLRATQSIHIGKTGPTFALASSSVGNFHLAAFRGAGAVVANEGLFPTEYHEEEAITQDFNRGAASDENNAQTKGISALSFFAHSPIHTHGDTNDHTDKATISLSFEQLLVESDLGTGRSGTLQRLIDLPEHSHDYSIWSEYLAFRRRVYGLEGVRAIFQALKIRGIPLPLGSEDADKIWPPFIELALRDPSFLEILWKSTRSLYRQTSKLYSPLYVQIVGHHLTQDTAKALSWHNRFRVMNYPIPGQLAGLVEHAIRCKDGLKTLKKIYNASDDRDLYNALIPQLYAANKYEDALHWHHHLMHVGDLPRDINAVEPLRRYLASQHRFDDLRKLTIQLVDAGVSFAKTLSGVMKDNTKISREMANLILGETYGVAPKPIRDEFCARCFATKGISVDFVIACLASFGLNRLGPLALRELAIRANHVDEIALKLSRLKEADILLHECVFSRLVQKLVKERRQELLDSVLGSDQHPDVYEDVKLQQALLREYVQAQDWPQVYRTVAILAASESDCTQPTVEAWNLLLQNHIDSKDWISIKTMVEDMIIHKIAISPQIVATSILGLLRSRNRGQKATTVLETTNDLSFVTNVLISICRANDSLPRLNWKEIFLRHAQEGRLSDVENITEFLLQHHLKHATRLQTDTLKLGRRSHLSLDPMTLETTLSAHQASLASAAELKRIFSPAWQQAVIAWGFSCLNIAAHAGPKPTTLPDCRTFKTSTTLPAWTWGVQFLSFLRSRGVDVKTATVRNTCRTELLILFGPGRSREKENVLAATTNPFSLKSMMQHLNVAWPADQLFRLPTKGLRSTEHAGNQALRRSVFGPKVGYAHVQVTRPPAHGR